MSALSPQRARTHKNGKPEKGNQRNESHGGDIDWWALTSGNGPVPTRTGNEGRLQELQDSMDNLVTGSARWIFRSLLVALILAAGLAPTATAGAENFRMPNLVGVNLQTGQDLLQARGSYGLRQVDASGMGRFLVWDRNWKICKTRPRAGKSVSVNALVTVWAVKLEERCP